jgi:iron(III) transport system permease protein
MVRAPLQAVLYAALMAVIALPFLTLIHLASVAPTGGGVGTLSHYVATVLPGYVRTSFALAAIAVSLAVVMGAACAWQIERYQFPGRDTLAWALMLPLAMPAYVAAYVMADFTQFSGPVQSALRSAFGWSKGDYWFPEATSFAGAVVCFAFTLYPYVYLLARSAFAERGHELQDAARSLGMGRSRAWWSAVLPAARPAIAAGGLLALMEVLADYGAVSYLGVDTLSVGIFRAWYNMSDITSAAQLALALLIVVIVAVYAERHLRSRARYASTRARFVPRVPLSGAPGIARTLLCTLPVLLGFALPAVLLVRLHLQIDGATPWRETLGWMGNSIQVGLWVAVVTLTLAIVLETRQRLWGERTAAWMSRVLGLGYAVPGAVLALGILIPLAALDNRLIDAIRGLGGVSPGLLLTGSIVALVYAISVRFYGVAGNATASAYSRIPASLDDCARALGLGRPAILARVHWPLARRALLAAGLLVFIDTLKELPATLALRPFDFNTLATATYNFARDERLAEAALPSLLIVLASLPAVILLTRRTRDT